MQIKAVIDNFKGKHILLLQGPVGPFFYRFAKALKQNNAEVTKINFNGGDFFFFPFGAKSFRGELDSLEAYLLKICQETPIDAFVMFNDCRPVHKVSLKVANDLGIPGYVFEEGYIRPDYVTFEQNGVNANSQIPRNRKFYDNYGFQTHKEESKELSVKHAFRNMAWYSFLYWFFAFWLSPFFNNTLHHRSLSPWEMFPWFLSLFRKIYYILSEKAVRKRITQAKKNYFVAVLQVYNDTQIKNHFGGRRIENFIKNTIQSFAKNAKPQHFLVIKHHPMDRGYKEYSKFICKQVKKYNLNDKVLYIHETHLPTLLQNALGCIVINSTAGISALHHRCPLKVCGQAFYDIEGLTFQESLDKFWNKAKKFKIDVPLYNTFRDYLIEKTQINGSFYNQIGGGF